MTLIVGWLACDQRGPCSAYMASDGRISNRRQHYDNSQKIFALKNTPDILGFCGEVIFPSQFLNRLTGICDSGMLLRPEMDYEERSRLIFREIKQAYLKYQLNDIDIKIFHIGRNQKKLFDANVYAYDGSEWSSREISTNYQKSMLLFSDGSGKKEFDGNFMNFKNGNNEDTSRNYFHCFCDVIKKTKDQSVGGVPQLVGLYNGKNNGMYHGIIMDGRAYYQGMEMGEDYDLSGVRWYNENFEICDCNTLQRQEGAAVQPVSQRANL